MHRRVPRPIGILRSCFGILARHECIIVGGCGVVLRAVRVPVVIVVRSVILISVVCVRRNRDWLHRRCDVLCLFRGDLLWRRATVGREGHHGEVVVLPTIAVVPLKDQPDPVAITDRQADMRKRLFRIRGVLYRIRDRLVVWPLWEVLEQFYGASVRAGPTEVLLRIIRGNLEEVMSLEN